MTGHLENTSGFDRGLFCLQLMGWIIVLLSTIATAHGAPHLQNAPMAGATVQERQSGSGKSRYTRMEDVLKNYGASIIPAGNTNAKGSGF